MSNHRKHHLNQTSCPRQYAIVEVARRLKFDTVRPYREPLKEDSSSRPQSASGLNIQGTYAKQNYLWPEIVEQLGPSERFATKDEIDFLICIILNEPSWRGRVGSPTWRASVDVETRLERAHALDDWHNRMIFRVRQRLLKGIWDDAVEQAEDDQTLGAVLEIDDRARALSITPGEKGTLTMPKEAASLEKLLRDPNYAL